MKRLKSYPYVVAIIDEKVWLAPLEDGYLSLFAGQIDWQPLGENPESKMIEEIISCLNLNLEQQLQLGLICKI